MMEIKKAALTEVAATIGQLPPERMPEFVFAGKSNVGKSSLINTLTNRKKLARTSSEPGKTRTINFYTMNDSFQFVDLPGYGYARISRSEQERFSRVIDYYLNHRSNIVRIFLLVDIRHEPGDGDRTMAEWMMACGFEPVLIATKADKLSRSRCISQLAMLRKELSLPRSAPVFAFSALTGQGKEEILNYIASFMISDDSDPKSDRPSSDPE